MHEISIFRYFRNISKSTLRRAALYGRHVEIGIFDSVYFRFCYNLSHILNPRLTDRSIREYYLCKKAAPRKFLFSDHSLISILLSHRLHQSLFPHHQTLSYQVRLPVFFYHLPCLFSRSPAEVFQPWQVIRDLPQDIF